MNNAVSINTVCHGYGIAIFLAELRALDRVEKVMIMNGILSFFPIKSLPFGPFGAETEWTHPLVRKVLECRHKLLRTTACC